MFRREILKSGLLLSAGQLALSNYVDALTISAARHGVTTEQPFDFAWLKGHARWLAGNPYIATPNTLPIEFSKMGYDQYQSIHFRKERSLWADVDLGFQLQFFHVGSGFMQPVRIFEVDAGKATEIVYSPAMFDLGASGISSRFMHGKSGFAGFRVQFVSNWEVDVAAFLGAAYFRAVGSDARQYGISARALAVDTALNRPEEFPRFTAFWFERPDKNSSTLTLYALFDSPSVAGAMRLSLTPGGTQVMDTDVAFYPRKAIERFGIAPLTSMFYYAQSDRHTTSEWRPEIHDSDGLSLWTGAGEWIWRPLTNPRDLHVNAYVDNNPRGFGLSQRDRNFDHYQDDGALYDRRPNLWIEPKSGLEGGWGKGAVQLVEIPTSDEFHDNIVVFWVPTDPPKPGQEILFSYRMYWGTQMPFASSLGQTIATRATNGDMSGQLLTHPAGRFAVDFAGGELGTLAKNAEVEAVVSTSRGQIDEFVTAHYVPQFNGYRALFEIRSPDDSVEPINLRLYLRLHGRPLTETWVYQWTPPSH